MSAHAETDRGALTDDTPDLETLSGALRYFFRFAGPKFLTAQMLLALALRPFFGGVGVWDAAVVAGVLVYWPLQEWFFHWTLLHMKPKKLGPFTLDPYFSRSHRYHHRHPWRIETAMLPMRVLFTIAPFHLLFWWLVTPSVGVMLTGVAAFTLATLVYEWTHYLTHTPYRPRGRYYRWIRRNHRMHHFRNEHYWHSFTAPFLDSMFGTGPEPKDVPRSDTCHDLGVRDD
ncbi:MAG TPA: sterol desaturase family protein [Sandaracinaceae bacterium LLY-WYZ-13_1]|nr:sterol desaturase family protein [Sandaracinaceae bacterium LLY-WYZ-13_1]